MHDVLLTQYPIPFKQEQTNSPMTQTLMDGKMLCELWRPVKWNLVYFDSLIDLKNTFVVENLNTL